MRCSNLLNQKKMSALLKLKQEAGKDWRLQAKINRKTTCLQHSINKISLEHNENNMCYRIKEGDYTGLTTAEEIIKQIKIDLARANRSYT